MNEPTMNATSTDAPPLWQPLNAQQRRVLGVMIEKAKTTPDNYPLSLNALRNGCNQKSNRFPQMQMEEVDVEDTLESLRELKAAIAIQGGSRVEKHRHLAYDWLGVDKTEIAIMGELLLRGPQTLGELRGRAARMEAIKDMSALKPLIDALVARKLVVYLTPQGRGAIVTHGLHLEREWEKIRRDAGAHHDAGQATTSVSSPSANRHTTTSNEGQASQLQEDLDVLKQEVAALRHDFESLRSQLL